jgi:hypothetical protein
MSDLQSNQPRPIKVSDSVSNSKRADAKALENAKNKKSNRNSRGNALIWQYYEQVN